MKKIIYSILIALIATSLIMVLHYKIFWISFYATAASVFVMMILRAAAFKWADVKSK